MRLLLIACFIYCSACQKWTGKFFKNKEQQQSQSTGLFSDLEKKEIEMDKIWTELKTIVITQKSRTSKSETKSSQNKGWKNFQNSLSPVQKKKWEKMARILAKNSLQRGLKAEKVKMKFIKAQAEFYESLLPPQRKQWKEEMNKTKAATTTKDIKRHKKWTEVLKAITDVDHALIRYKDAKTEWEKSVQE